MRRAWLSEPDVALYGVVEEVDVLENRRKVLKKAVAREVSHVAPAHEHCAFADVPKAHHEVGYRGLSRTGRADDGARGAFGDRKARFSEGLLAAASRIGERHVLELDGAAVQGKVLPRPRL